MTTPNFSILLQLGGKRNGSRSRLKKSGPRRIYSVSRLGGLLAFLMVFSAVFTAVSYSSSPTSSRLTPARANQPKSAQRNSRVWQRKEEPSTNCCGIENPECFSRNRAFLISFHRHRLYSKQLAFSQGTAPPRKPTLISLRRSASK